MANAWRGHPPRSDRDDLNEALSKVYPRAAVGLDFRVLCVFICRAHVALKRRALSVVYAIWVGIGAVLITLIGFWYFDEQATLFKAACIALIVIGVVGLNYSTNV
jgi:multidrug transporter EmrE-like cation transporter